MVLLLCVFLRAWTAAIDRLDLELQFGLFRPSWLGLGLDRRRPLDPMCCACNGRAVQ